MAWTDEKIEQFDAWCRERAREIRHIAAARGWPAEYAYLKQHELLRAQLRESFPDVSDMFLDQVRIGCQYPDGELDLAEINKLRDQDGVPPLDFIPEVLDVPRFPPPQPKAPPPQDEMSDLFHAWMVKEVSTAYHVAEARGITPEEAMFAVPSILVDRIMSRFPGMNPARCLRVLEHGLFTHRPERLDPARVASLKAWNDTFRGMIEEIEGSINALPGPNLKQ